MIRMGQDDTDRYQDLPFAAFRSVQRNPSPEKTIEFALSVLIVTLVNLFKDSTHINDPILVVVEELGEEVVELVNLEESSINTELENVKSFTRTNINKPDFTPRKTRKSQHFWRFKPTKQNLWGFL